tara:strand:- start:48 stop:5660 length:5613 start_codon:yes stop_codon:yes gene_type:complete
MSIRVIDKFKKPVKPSTNNTPPVNTGATTVAQAKAGNTPDLSLDFLGQTSPDTVASPTTSDDKSQDVTSLGPTTFTDELSATGIGRHLVRTATEDDFMGYEGGQFTRGGDFYTTPPPTGLGEAVPKPQTRLMAQFNPDYFGALGGGIQYEESPTPDYLNIEPSPDDYLGIKLYGLSPNLGAISGGMLSPDQEEIQKKFVEQQKILKLNMLAQRYDGFDPTQPKDQNLTEWIAENIIGLDPNVPPERRLEGIQRGIGTVEFGLTAGAKTTLAALNLLSAYSLGTVEKAYKGTMGLFGSGQGAPDYDKTYYIDKKNPIPYEWVNDRLSELVKKYKLEDLNLLERTAIASYEFAVSLFGGKEIKGIAKFAHGSFRKASDRILRISSEQKVLRDLPKVEPFAAPQITKVEELIGPAIKAKIETRNKLIKNLSKSKLATLAKAEAKAKGHLDEAAVSPSRLAISRLNNEIGQAKANVTKQVLQDIKPSFWKNVKAKVKEKNLTAKARPQTVVGTVRGKVDETTGMPTYETASFQYIKPKDILGMQKHYRDIMYYNAAAGAGFAMTMWEDATAGTKWEPYKHLAGLLGVWANPPAAYKVVESVLNRAGGLAGRARLKLPSNMVGKQDNYLQGELSFPMAFYHVAKVLDKVFKQKQPSQYTRTVEIPAPEYKEVEKIIIGKDGKKRKVIVDEPDVRTVEFQEFAGETIFNTTFGRRVMAWSQGLGPFDIFVADTKRLLKDSNGALINPRQVIDKRTGEKIVIGDTELDAVMALRMSTLQKIDKHAEMVARMITPEQVEAYKKAWSQASKLHEDLAKLGSGLDVEETFYATINQIQATVTNQHHVAMATQALADKKSRNAFFGALSNWGNEGLQLSYNFIRAAQKEAEENLAFVQKALLRLSGAEPEVVLKFEGLLGQMKNMASKLEKRNATLKAEIGNIAEFDAKHALDLRSSSLLNEIITGSKGEGMGTGVGGKFGIQRLGGEADVDALTKHGEDFVNALSKAENVVKNDIDNLYTYKNSPNSVSFTIADTPANAEEFVNSFKFLRNRDIGSEVNVLNRLLKAHSNFGMVAKSDVPTTFYDDLIATARFNYLNSGDFNTSASLIALANKIDDLGLPLTLNNNVFRSDSGREITLRQSTDTFDNIDIRASLKSLDDVGDANPAFALHSDLETAKIIYLQRFIANLKTIPNRAPVDAEEQLARMLPAHLSANEIIGVRKFLAARTGPKQFLTEAERNLLPSIEEANKIISKLGIEGAEEAAEQWVKYVNSFRSPLGILLKQPFDAGSKRITEQWEVPEYIFRNSADETIPVLEKMFESYTKANKQTISFNEAKNSMRDVLDDTAILMLINQEKRNIILRDMNKLKKLNKAGFLSDQTYNVIKTFKEEIDDVAKNVEIFKDIVQKENNLKTLIKTVGTALDNTTRKSILGNEKILSGEVSDLFDFLTATGIKIDQKPILPQAFREQTVALEKQVSSGMDIIEAIKGNPFMKRSQLESMIREIQPKSIYDAQGKRQDVFLETFFGIKPNATTITKDQKKRLEDLAIVLQNEMIKRSIVPVKDERRSIFQPNLTSGFRESKFGEAMGLPSNRFFGLSTDIDVVKFGELMNNVMPLFKRINSLTGNTTRNENLDRLFQASVLIKSVGPESKAAMELLGRIPTGITMPAALSRLYAGFRGVVSWRYLASEQIIREHQRSKAMMLHTIYTDPTFMKALVTALEAGVYGTKNVPKEDIKYLRKTIRRIMGGRIIVYNEEGDIPPEDEISDENFLVGLLNSLNQAGFEIFGFDMHKSTGLLRTERRDALALDRGSIPGRVQLLEDEETAVKEGTGFRGTLANPLQSEAEQNLPLTSDNVQGDNSLFVPPLNNEDPDLNLDFLGQGE